MYKVKKQFQKYKTSQKYGCTILESTLKKIDTNYYYKIVGYATAFENRPIISRYDDSEYLGETKWIVNEMNLYKED